MSRKSSDTNDIIRRFYMNRFSVRDQHNCDLDLIVDVTEDLDL